MTVRTHDLPQDPPAPVSVAPRRVSVLSGALAVFGALGASHLVAASVRPSSSPFVAVGAVFIDLTPSWLKTLAIDTFGTADKTALLVGMALVMALLGVGVGLAARRDLRLGFAAMVMIGLTGLVAVLTRPGLGAVSVLAPLTAIGVGVLTLWWLDRAVRASWFGAGSGRGPGVVPSSDPAGSGTGTGMSRRTFVRSSVVVGVAAAVAAFVGQRIGTRATVTASRAGVGTLAPGESLPPVPTGADFVADGGLPFITPNSDFYRIDTALFPPRVSAADWSLRIHGMVDREITIDFEELVARGLISRRVTFACVSYDLGGDLVGTAEWTGVDLRALLMEAGVAPGADQILSRSVDGFTASTPVEVVMEPDRGAMLAVNMNGEPLPVEHGFPVRMLVPGLYGYVSATKWITELELTTFAAQPAYWTERGWGERGPVKTASKVVSSRSTGSGLTVTGAAWATHVGISAVQARLDDGEWVEARLGDGDDPDTWRMWRVDFADVPAGEHTVTCRATDARGEVQTDVVAPPVPDGATGWHTARVKVG